MQRWTLFIALAVAVVPVPMALALIRGGQVIVRSPIRAGRTPRYSACHCPPPKGGPSHQAMRAALLKIAAAPKKCPCNTICVYSIVLATASTLCFLRDHGVTGAGVPASRRTGRWIRRRTPSKSTFATAAARCDSASMNSTAKRCACAIPAASRSGTSAQPRSARRPPTAMWMLSSAGTYRKPRQTDHMPMGPKRHRSLGRSGPDPDCRSLVSASRRTWSASVSCKGAAREAIVIFF